MPCHLLVKTVGLQLFSSPDLFHSCIPLATTTDGTEETVEYSLCIQYKLHCAKMLLSLLRGVLHGSGLSTPDTRRLCVSIAA